MPPEPTAYTPPPGAAPYAGNTGPRRADENVSAAKSFHNVPSNSTSTAEGNTDTPLYDTNGVPFYMSSGEGA